MADKRKDIAGPQGDGEGKEIDLEKEEKEYWDWVEAVRDIHDDEDDDPELYDEDDDAEWDDDQGEQRRRFFPKS